MDTKQIALESSQAIKKLIETPRNINRNPTAYSLDQKSLENLWNCLEKLRDTDQLQQIIIPFYGNPNLENVQATLNLIELLEYLYSKNAHLPILRALNDSIITDFFENAALSKNQGIKDKAIYCLFTVSNKLRGMDQVNCLMELKKKLILVHDIVCVDTSESPYFTPFNPNAKPKSQNPLSLEEFLKDQSQGVVDETNEKEKVEAKKYSSMNDFFKALQDRQMQQKVEASQEHDPSIKLEYPNPLFSQDLKKSISPPSNQYENSQFSQPKSYRGDKSSVRILDVSASNITKVNESISRPSKVNNKATGTVVSSQREEESRLDKREIASKTTGSIGAENEDNKVINLTLDELLDFKKVNNCNRKDCEDYEDVEVLTKKDFLNNNDLIKCSRYHNHTDKRRYPLSKREPKKSSYSHTQLCSACLRDQAHRGRCKLSNNWFEVYYHPNNYKLKKCQNETCKTDTNRRKYCPFYHNIKEREEWNTVLLDHFGYDRTSVRFTVEVTNESSDPDEGKSDTAESKASTQGNASNSSQKQRTQSRGIEEQKAQEIMPDSNSPRFFKKKNESPSKFEKRSVSPKKSSKNSQTSKTPDRNADLWAEKPSSTTQYKPVLHYQKKTSGYSDYEEALKNKFIYKDTRLRINGDEAEENKMWEFKNYRGPDYTDMQWDEILKAIGGFLNGDGGKLLIGVDDEGIVRGTKMGKKGYDDFKNKLISAILSHISPKIDDTHYKINNIAVLRNGDSLNEENRYKYLLIEITIKKGTQVIYFVRKDTEVRRDDDTVRKEQHQVCYQRFDASTRILRGDQINELIISRTLNMGNR